MTVGLAELATAATAGLGAAWVLRTAPWFRRPRLVTRLAPYLPGAPPPSAAEVSSARLAVVQLVSPGLQAIGNRIASTLGVRDPLADRLARIHAADDPATFRIRQLGWGIISLSAGGLACAVLRPPVLLAPAVLLGASALAVLLVEQRLSTANAAWQRRVSDELPLVCEQIGMLLRAGRSLTAAIDHIADHGRGACAADLRRVRLRQSQGLGVHDALSEWAELVGVDGARQLVATLRLQDHAADVGALVAEEARGLRAEAHRRLLEEIELRAQKVWIPVTVATLVPGVILLGIPFTTALKELGAA